MPRNTSFNQWLKLAIQQIDSKVDEGFSKIDRHLEKLNGSVQKNQISIIKLSEWKEDHIKEHDDSTKRKMFFAKLVIGSGGLAGLVLLLLNFV